MKIRNRSRFDASIHAAGVRAASSCAGTVVQPVCIPHKARYLVISKQGVPQRQLETTLSVPHTTSITFVFLRGLYGLSHLQWNSIRMFVGMKIDRSSTFSHTAEVDFARLTDIKPP